MAIVKCKPTSPGRRFVVKVVNQELHKGAPHAPLLEKNRRLVVVTTMVVLPLVTSVVAISSIIVWSISVATTKMASLPLSSVLNTIQTVLLTSLCCCTQMASVATSSPLKA